MKDITIKGKYIKKELIYLLISLILGFVLNLYSIIRYETEWKELFTTLHVTLFFSLIIYALIGIFRLIIKGIISVASLTKKN